MTYNLAQFRAYMHNALPERRYDGATGGDGGGGDGGGGDGGDGGGDGGGDRGGGDGGGDGGDGGDNLPPPATNNALAAESPAAESPGALHNPRTIVQASPCTPSQPTAATSSPLALQAAGMTTRKKGSFHQRWQVNVMNEFGKLGTLELNLPEIESPTMLHALDDAFDDDTDFIVHSQYPEAEASKMRNALVVIARAAQFEEARQMGCEEGFPGLRHDADLLTEVTESLPPPLPPSLPPSLPTSSSASLALIPHPPTLEDKKFERARRQSFAASAYLLAQPHSGGSSDSASSVYPMPKYGQVVANMEQADVQRRLFETQLNCKRSVLLGKDGSQKKKAWMCKSGLEYLAAQNKADKGCDLATIVRNAPESMCFGCFQVQAFGSLAKLCEGTVQHESKLAIAINGGKRKAATLCPGDFAQTIEGQAIEIQTLVSKGAIKNSSGMSPEEILLQPCLLAFNVVRPHHQACSTSDSGRSKKGKAPVVSAAVAAKAIIQRHGPGEQLTKAFIKSELVSLRHDSYLPKWYAQEVVKTLQNPSQLSSRQKGDLAQVWAFCYRKRGSPAALITTDGDGVRSQAIELAVSHFEAAMRRKHGATGKSEGKYRPLDEQALWESNKELWPTENEDGEVRYLVGISAVPAAMVGNVQSYGPFDALDATACKGNAFGTCHYRITLNAMERKRPITLTRFLSAESKGGCRGFQSSEGALHSPSDRQALNAAGRTCVLDDGKAIRGEQKNAKPNTHTVQCLWHKKKAYGRRGQGGRDVLEVIDELTALPKIGKTIALNKVGQLSLKNPAAGWLITRPDVSELLPCAYPPGVHAHAFTTTSIAESFNIKSIRARYQESFADTFREWDVLLCNDALEDINDHDEICKIAKDAGTEPVPTPLLTSALRAEKNSMTQLAHSNVTQTNDGRWSVQSSDKTHAYNVCPGEILNGNWMNVCQCGVPERHRYAVCKHVAKCVASERGWVNKYAKPWTNYNGLCAQSKLDLPPAQRPHTVPITGAEIAETLIYMINA